MYREVVESQTLLINTQSKQLAARNKEIIQFGFGQSPFLPPSHVLNALQSSVHHKEYSSVQGDPELRALMAAFHKDHNGLNVRPDHILLAPGSKILLFNILLAHANADVLIPAPAWVSYAPQAKLAGHNTIRIRTSYEDRWRVTPSAISEAIRHKRHVASILILNYPGNPDGLTYTQNELEDLAQSTRASDILVISDEIYGLLDHRFNHLSFADFYPDKTITITGISKWCGAGGWRLGAAFLSDGIYPALKEVLIGIGSETYSCAPVPVQKAARAAYHSFEDTTGYLAWQVKILDQIGQYCAETLNAARIRVHSPQGGFYLLPDFSWHRERLHAAGIQTAHALCQKLLHESGVVLLPGSAFGLEEDDLTARLAYVDFDPPPAVSAFDPDRDCPRVKAGVHAIADWVSSL